MKNSTFYAQFSTEKKCTEFIYSFYKEKVKCCPKCGSEKLKWTLNSKSWRCHSCTKRISLKSVTFMRDSNKSFREWLEIIFLQLRPKKAFSIKEIMSLTGQIKYDTVYHMIRKIDNELGRINAALTDKYETILSFEGFENLPPEFPKHLHMTYVTTPSRKHDKIRFVLSQEDLQRIRKIKKDRLEEKCYSFPKVFSHAPDKDDEQIPRIFKNVPSHWKRILKENLIRVLDGIYHEISLAHLQATLDDFSFKYNNRRSEIPKLTLFFQEAVKCLGRIRGTQPMEGLEV